MMAFLDISAISSSVQLASKVTEAKSLVSVTDSADLACARLPGMRSLMLDVAGLPERSSVIDLKVAISPIQLQLPQLRITCRGGL